MVTSSAVVGSSAINKTGLLASAMAIKDKIELSGKILYDDPYSDDTLDALIARRFAENPELLKGFAYLQGYNISEDDENYWYR